MTRDAPTPLFHPFETGVLDLPDAAARMLLLGARPSLRLPSWLSGRARMVQGFRPDFLALSKAGHAVEPEPAGEAYDLALVLATRHRGENEARLAAAVERLRPGGLIVMAGGRTDGVSSLRKRLAKAVPLDGHLAKNHGEVFWLRRGREADGFARATRADQASSPLVEGRFRAAPGMFSHERVDAGSRLLAVHLPPDLEGEAADFCAGWGYLSVALAETAPHLAGLNLYEADFASLEAARANMAALAPGVRSGFHWLDLAAEPVARRYDVVVMNPPFHRGRAAEPDIGLAMIRAAAKALKPAGRLFMVANRGLPYEPALKAAFARVEERADATGFKVWTARR